MIFTNGRLSPISDGLTPRLRVSPRPSCPWSFFPQHLTDRFSSGSSKRAQVCEAPAATARRGPVVPRSVSAIDFPHALVAPTPNSPLVKFPQLPHATFFVPLRAVRRQTWMPPPERDRIAWDLVVVGMPHGTTDDGSPAEQFLVRLHCAVRSCCQREKIRLCFCNFLPSTVRRRGAPCSSPRSPALDRSICKLGACVILS